MLVDVDGHVLDMRLLFPKVLQILADIIPSEEQLSTWILIHREYNHFEKVC